MNKEIDEEEFKALLTDLKEINTILNKNEMTAKQVRYKYGMPYKVVYDIRDINPNLLDEEHLKDIVSLLKTENKRTVRIEYDIGAGLLNYIDQRLDISIEQDEYYAELYEQMQDIWKRVGRGETIAGVAKTHGLDTEKVEGLLYPYHQLIKRLQILHREGDTKSKTLPNTNKYNFGPEVLDYIENGNPVIDENIDRELMPYIHRISRGIGDNIGGGKGIEL